jgi:GNAT superfamily N-acetyltransferase
MPTPDIQLVIPGDAQSLEITRGIFREYVGSLNIDLQFQNIEDELARLPGEYAAPEGHLLLAFVDEELAGCGALRRITDVDYPNACEMKRLYVRPAFRRFGLGRLLAQALFDEARSLGYSTMLLDTLDGMEAARGLYESLGFEEIPPYYYSPIADSHYLKADLA